MTADIKQFNRDLDQLLYKGEMTLKDEALDTAALLLSLDFDSVSAPQTDLRARWISHTAHKLKSKTTLQRFYARPVLLMIIVLLAIATITGVAIALGKKFGYIPGTGLVDQNSTVLILEKPISASKNGLTINISQVVSDSKHVIVQYSIEPPEISPEILLSPDSSKPICEFVPDYVAKYLQLPDGSQISSLRGGPIGDGFVVEFPPISQEIDTMTIILGCDQGQATVHLIPAGEDSMIPVITMPAATQQVEPTSIRETKIPSLVFSILLENVVTLDDGYILTGTFMQNNGESVAFEPIFTENFAIVDANNSPVSFEPTWIADINSWSVDTTTMSQTWSIKISGKDHTWPISISVQPILISSPLEVTHFSIDLGDDPQVGESWDIGLEILLNGEFIAHVDSVSLIQGVAPLEDPNSYGLDFSISTGSSNTPKLILQDNIHPFKLLGGGGGPEGYNLSYMYENGYRPLNLVDISVFYQSIYTGPVLQMIFQP